MVLSGWTRRHAHTLHSYLIPVWFISEFHHNNSTLVEEIPNIIWFRFRCFLLLLPSFGFSWKSSSVFLFLQMVSVWAFPSGSIVFAWREQLASGVASSLSPWVWFFFCLFFLSWVSLFFCKLTETFDCLRITRSLKFKPWDSDASSRSETMAMSLWGLELSLRRFRGFRHRSGFSRTLIDHFSRKNNRVVAETQKKNWPGRAPRKILSLNPGGGYHYHYFPNKIILVLFPEIFLFLAPMVALWFSVILCILV